MKPKRKKPWRVEWSVTLASGRIICGVAQTRWAAREAMDAIWRRGHPCDVTDRAVASKAQVVECE